MTTIARMREAVTQLRRIPFIDYSVQPPVRRGPRFPIPYVADIKEYPENEQTHGAIKNSIISKDGALLCQVCGIPFDDGIDPSLYLISDDDMNFLYRDNFITKYMNDEFHQGVRVTTNVGPVHLWCTRVSLMFCPEIKTNDPEHIVAWIDPSKISESFPDDSAVLRLIGGGIERTVHPSWLITLAELDERIAKQKKSEK